MSNAKEIRTQIKSIQNTKKITKAMEMVAASKMRKAQTHMEESRPYAHKIKMVAADIARANTEIDHPFLSADKHEKIGYIVVSSDRGLCGGLNINVFKALIQDMQAQEKQGREVVVATYGGKATKFLSAIGCKLIASKTNYGDKPSLVDLIGPIRIMIEAYNKGDIDHLYLVSNEFVNTMTQQPTISQLLPVPEKLSEIERQHSWDYLYEPEAGELLNEILLRYIEAQIKSAVSENIACEMAARMIAMKSATDNAGNLIDEKQLQYNKARQASITQELSEIVAGAAAV